ncbi:MAG: PAS domain-containing protein [Bacteroidales bacterium]|jgi:hypothetical protein|nr:PAS domain-containing protein [Bacteroidales bacterium]
MDQPANDLIKLSTGNFTVEELEAIFSALPAEVSFVDKNDIVRFFSNKPDRLFLRGKGALGRDLRLCHPPRFQAVMQQIIGDFKSGKEDRVLFWRSSHKDKFISIEYIALRNENKEYLGTLEVVQDISDIRILEGDRQELVYTKKG